MTPPALLQLAVLRAPAVDAAPHGGSRQGAARAGSRRRSGSSPTRASPPPRREPPGRVRAERPRRARGELREEAAALLHRPDRLHDRGGGGRLRDPRPLGRLRRSSPAFWSSTPALDFWQDRKATNALAALKKGLAPKATALRDGKLETVAAATLVPGDIVKIRLGAIVPADLRLVAGDYASIDQSALTGESLPAAKKVGDEAYSGSVVKQGEMTGVVIATGGQTFFGRTAKLVAGAGARQPRAEGDVRDRQLPDRRRGRARAVMVAVRSTATSSSPTTGAGRRARHPAVRAGPARRLDPGRDAGGLLDHHGARRSRPLEAEGDRLASSSAIEEMAGVDILCSDKTGTLTKNQLTLGDPILFAAKDAAEDCILAGALASQLEDRRPDRHRGDRGAEGPERAEEPTSRSSSCPSTR